LHIESGIATRSCTSTLPAAATWTAPGTRLSPTAGRRTEGVPVVRCSGSHRDRALHPRRHARHRRAFGNGTSRNYKARGSGSLASQGGSASGCKVANDALAIVVNVGSLSPVNAGVRQGEGVRFRGRRRRRSQLCGAPEHRWRAQPQLVGTRERDRIHVDQHRRSDRSAGDSDRLLHRPVGRACEQQGHPRFVFARVFDRRCAETHLEM
jgi:hypothetical protein